MYSGEMSKVEYVKMIAVGTTQATAVCIAIMAVIQVVMGMGTVTEMPYGASAMVGHVDNVITAFFGVV